MLRWSWFRIAETSAIAWIAACEQLEAVVQLACSRAQNQDRSVWKLSDGNVCDSGQGMDRSVVAVWSCDMQVVSCGCSSACRSSCLWSGRAETANTWFVAAVPDRSKASSLLVVLGSRVYSDWDCVRAIQAAGTDHLCGL